MVTVGCKRQVRRWQLLPVALCPEMEKHLKLHWQTLRVKNWHTKYVKFFSKLCKKEQKCHTKKGKGYFQKNLLKKKNSCEKLAHAAHLLRPPFSISGCAVLCGLVWELRRNSRGSGESGTHHPQTSGESRPGSGQ